MAMALLIAVKEERVFILLPGNPGKHPTPVARLLRVYALVSYVCCCCCCCYCSRCCCYHCC